MLVLNALQNGNNRLYSSDLGQVFFFHIFTKAMPDDLEQRCSRVCPGVLVVVQALFRLFPSSASVLVVQLSSSVIRLKTWWDLFTSPHPHENTTKQQPVCWSMVCF